MSLSAADHHQSQRFLRKRKISDLPFAEKIYDLLNISEDIAEKAKLRVLDEIPEDNLILVHYFDQSDMISSVSHIRGVVIDTSEDIPKIIAESFPYTEEVLLPKNSEDSVLNDLSEGTITQAFEGTVLRVFRGRKTGKWYMSTHKKIDGKNSRWSGPSFGKIFDELWGLQDDHPFESYFLKDNCYIFLVSHPENKLVCDTPVALLRLVGVFTPIEHNSTGTLVIAGSDELKLIQPHPNVNVQTSLNIKDKDDFLEQLGCCKWKECSGLIVYNHLKKTCHKFISNEYSTRREIRGNEPNLRLRYLQLSKIDASEGGKDNVDNLFELFPEKVEYFKEVENNRNLILPYLENLYTNRYKLSDESLLPKEDHYILEKTRRNYDPELTLSDNILSHVNLSNARQTNAMIKHMLSFNKKAISPEV